MRRYVVAQKPYLEYNIIPHSILLFAIFNNNAYGTEHIFSFLRVGLASFSDLNRPIHFFFLYSIYGFQHPSPFETYFFYQKEFRNFLRAKSSFWKYILTSRTNHLIVWRGSWNVRIKGDSAPNNCVGIARAFVKSKETVKLVSLLRLLK